MMSKSPPRVPAEDLLARVLIAAGDGAVATMVEAALRRVGITVARATTAGEALTLLHATPCDAMVVTSAMLLSDDQRLLRGPDGTSVPVVVLLDPDPRHGQADLSGCVVLPVPFTEQDLLDAMAAAFGAVDGSISPLLDHEALARLWPDDAAELLRKVIDVFGREVDTRCVAVADALKRLDRSAIRHQAHTLKGASANVCAARLERAARWLEASAAIASVAMLERAAADLCDVARLTAAAMERFRAEGA